MSGDILRHMDVVILGGLLLGSLASILYVAWAYRTEHLAELRAIAADWFPDDDIEEPVSPSAEVIDLAEVRQRTQWQAVVQIGSRRARR